MIQRLGQYPSMMRDGLRRQGTGVAVGTEAGVDDSDCVGTKVSQARRPAARKTGPPNFNLNPLTTVILRCHLAPNNGKPYHLGQTCELPQEI